MVGARQAIFMVMTEVGVLRPLRVGPQVGAKNLSPLPMTHIPWARHPRPGADPDPDSGSGLEIPRRFAATE